MTDTHPVLVKTHALQRDRRASILRNLMRTLDANPLAARVVLSKSTAIFPYYKRTWEAE